MGGDGCAYIYYAEQSDQYGYGGIGNDAMVHKTNIGTCDTNHNSSEPIQGMQVSCYRHV